MTSPMQTPNIFEVFRSESVLARAIVGMSPALCVVTFFPLDEVPGMSKPGFGEDFFRGQGIDAIHVISNGNHWYQYEELRELCRRISALTASYRRVVSYGSSMGGYAAIRYGQWVGAHLALALSPQYSVRPMRFPFERRWRHHASRIRFMHEHAHGVVRRAIIVYDPLDKDAQHVRLFQKTTDVECVALPGSGHPSIHFLHDLAVLQSTVLDVCYERFDASGFTRDVMSRKEESPRYHAVRAQRAGAHNAQFLRSLWRVLTHPLSRILRDLRR